MSRAQILDFVDHVLVMGAGALHTSSRRVWRSQQAHLTRQVHTPVDASAA